MNKRILIQTILSGMLAIYGCKGKVTEKQYVDFINDPDNKILQQIKVGNVQASMKWLPGEYRNLSGKRDSSSNSAEQDNFFYFNAKLEKVEGEKPDKNKILYLDFDMQNDFVLYANGDSITPSICQKIENGIPGSYEYMLAFDKTGIDDRNDNFSVVYTDKIFGIGAVAFVYDQHDIKRIPKLKSSLTQ